MQTKYKEYIDMAYSLSFSKSILVLIFISDKTRLGKTEFISTKYMSEILNIPRPTLTQMLGHLMRAGILQTKEGINGGVRLLKSEENISIYDILVAIENEKPLFQTDYLLNVDGDRPQKVTTAVNTMLNGIEFKIKDELRNVTLKSIIDSIK